MFLTEKRDNTIKGHACADGLKQRDWTEEGTTASPTVWTDAIYMMTAIEANEGQDVAVVDLLGAFLHADVDKDVTMLLE